MACDVHTVTVLDRTLHKGVGLVRLPREKDPGLNAGLTARGNELRGVSPERRRVQDVDRGPELVQ